VNVEINIGVFYLFFEEYIIMASFVLSVLMESSVWITKQTFNGIYYLVYGHVETPEEAIQNRLIEMEELDSKKNEEIMKLLLEMKQNEKMLMEEICALKEKIN
jgi:cell shape-determining protein MreC